MKIFWKQASISKCESARRSFRLGEGFCGILIYINRCQNCCTLFLGLALGLADDLLEDLAPDLEAQVDQKQDQLVSELSVLVRILPLTLLEVRHSILKNRCVRSFTIMEYSNVIYLIPWCPLNQDDSPVVELLVEPGRDETNHFLERIRIFKILI